MPTARANALDLAYEEQGTGEPVVLIAGIGMQLSGWPERFLERLSARGLRVIVFDNRDVGLSTKLDDRGVPNAWRSIARAVLGMRVRAPYTLFDMADDVIGLLDALGIDRAHIVGVSLGGSIAQAAAIAHPWRLKSMTSMMSHSGGMLLTASRPDASLKLLRHAPRSREEAIAGQLDFFRTVGSTGFERDETALAERVGRSYDRCFHPRGFARQFAAALATGDMTKRLAHVSVPTLVLHGTDDAMLRPACGRRTARAIPGATLRMIEGWGHDLPEGAFDLLIDAIAGHVHAHARVAQEEN